MERNPVLPCRGAPISIRDVPPGGPKNTTSVDARRPWNPSGYFRPDAGGARAFWVLSSILNHILLTSGPCVSSRKDVLLLSAWRRILGASSWSPNS